MCAILILVHWTYKVALLEPKFPNVIRWDYESPIVFLDNIPSFSYEKLYVKG